MCRTQWKAVIRTVILMLKKIGLSRYISRDKMPQIMALNVENVRSDMLCLIG